MVSAIALMDGIEKLVVDIYESEVQAENERYAEYKATNLLKAWFRGYSTRKKLYDMHLKAIVIQRHWRGFLGRRRFRRKLNERVRELALEYFNSCATKIQCCWRGFFTRKYMADYYQRKLRLKALDETNKEVRKHLANYAESLRQQNEQREQEQKMNTDVAWAESHHFLLSTSVQFGIYNSPFLPAPQSEEYLLMRTRPRQPPRADLNKKRREDRVWKSYNESPTTILPKLPPLKPQGPFREPDEVLKQRMRSFNPTLRVETDYESEEQARKQLESEEWLGRVNDKEFLYFFNSKKHYTPLIWTRSDFRQLKYGSQAFRDDSCISPAMRKRVDEGFKTILPPIPIFDKFGATYSQGEV